MQIFNRWEIYFLLILKSKELLVPNYFFDSSIAMLQQKKTNKLPSSCKVDQGLIIFYFQKDNPTKILVGIYV